MANVPEVEGRINETLATMTNEVRALKGKIDSGDSRSADLDTRIRNMEGAIGQLDAELANAKALAASAPAPVTGGSLVQRFGRGETLRMLHQDEVTKIAGYRDVKTCAAGVLTSAETLTDGHAEMKALFEAGVAQSVAVGAIRFGEKGVNRNALTKALAENCPSIVARIGAIGAAEGLADSAEGVIKRIFGVGAGNGEDYIPTETLLPELILIAGAAQASSLAGNFAQRQLNARNIAYATMSATPRPYNRGAATSTSVAEIARSAPVTGKHTMTPKSFASLMRLDREAEADEIMGMMAESRIALARSLALGLDDAIINGDTTATHGDVIAGWNPSGVFNSEGSGGDLDHRRMFLGLRHRALKIGSGAKIDFSGTVTEALIQELHSKMTGARGQSEARTLLITDFATYIKHLLTLPSVVTLDKLGPNATVLSGQLASVYGKPILRSPFMGRHGSNTGSYNNAGVYASSGNTKAAMIVVDADAYVIGTRKGITLEQGVEIGTDTSIVVASSRIAFESFDYSGVPTSASTVNATLGYNI